MPLGQFPPNVAVGLLASVRLLYARNLYARPASNRHGQVETEPDGTLGNQDSFPLRVA